MTTESAARFPTAAEVEGFWTWDKLHAPRPLTPLSSDIVTPALAEGFTRAMREFWCSVGMKFASYNYYAYARLFPLEFPGMTLAQRRARYNETTLVDVVPHCGPLWREQWLPSMLPGLEKARGTDYAALDDAALVATVDEMQEEHIRRWDVHGRINFVLIAASWFGDYYNELFSPEDRTEAYECLQGFNTLSVEAGRALWRLSRTVKQSPPLSRLFADLEPAELIAALSQSEEGRGFMGSFRDFLERWGWRSDAIYELSAPTWREDPAIPLNALQGYIQMDEEADPDIPYRRAVARRESLLVAARQRLASQPEKLERFNQLYDGAKDNLFITEDHNYYIDQMGVTVMRLPFLEFGRRLASRGQVDEVDDVFYLHFGELKASLLDGSVKQDVVKQRRAERDQAAKVVPPPVIGEPEHLDPEDPFIMAMGDKMLGLINPVEPSRDPNVINGVPASPGSVQGVVKVVRNLNEASKLQPGDIMVCEMTVPPWTPLFATVAAVVADTGGILSHCAIVAREYHLPAVVGTNVGTTVLKDGMTVTVDGSKGVVRIDTRP